MELSKHHYEGFSIFFEKPTREALQELLKTSIGETDYLDFKTEWGDDDSKLARHILALSNSGGGAIVYGIKQVKNDGKMESLGLSTFRDKSDINKGVKPYLPDNII